MPKNKIQKKQQDDKFYTKPEIAQICVDFLQSQVKEEKVTYVEPSAGSGSFSNITECVAYDIKPEATNIVAQDWLKFDTPPQGTWVMFGNPPFGSRNHLSKAFISKGIDKGCTYIGFVLPNSYKKFTTQTVFPSDWKLIGSIDLPKYSFLLEGEDYHVPCVFQVWTNSKEHTNNYREVKGKEFTKDFSFTNKFKGDLFIFGASPTKYCKTEEVLKNNRGYYLKLNIDSGRFLEKLSNINWKAKGNSTVSGGVSWFTKDEIVKIWEEYYGSE